MISYAKLILALAMVESGGDPHAVGDAGRSYGHLQIQRAVVEDVNHVYGTNYKWPRDARDPQVAEEICELYISYWMQKHCRATGARPSYQIAARIWNGGPGGPLRKTTLHYWNKVEKQLAKVKLKHEPVRITLRK